MTSMVQRVVARWMRRRAGLFEPPPAMRKAIFEWVVESYAAHTLAEVELLIERGIERIEYGKVWNRLLAQKAEVPRLIGASQPFQLDTSALGEKQTVRAEPQGGGGWEVSVEGAGARKDKPANTEDAVEWVRFLIDNQLRALFEASNPGRGPRGQKKRPSLNERVDIGQFQRWLVESIRIKKMLQPFAKTKPKRRSWVRKRFPLDLTGWKYLVDLDKEEFWANLARSSFDQIQVTLSFTPKNKSWDGLWRDMSYDLTLVAPSFPGIDVGKITNALADIKDTLEHELVHVAQTIIERGKRLKEEAGLPGKDLREKGVSPTGIIDPKLHKERGRKQDPHELQDVEFYTRLHDIVRDYERRVPTVPATKREEFFQQFIVADPWLRVLRRKAPRKYAKAISELRKAVDAWLPS